MKRSKVFALVFCCLLAVVTALPVFASEDAKCPRPPAGSATVHKVDSATLKGLAGADFELSNKPDFTGTVYKLTTDVNGYAYFNELTLGDWYLRETKAPAGYERYKDVIPVSVGNAVVVIEEKNCKLVPATLQFIKKDAATQKQLAGTVIGVYSDVEYKHLVAQCTTLDNTPVNVGNLAPGTYYIKEISAPTGYLADAKPQTITLSYGQTATIVLFNSRSYPTGTNDFMLLFCGAGLLIIWAVVAFAFYRARRCKQ